jgi:hypothetical protein
VVAEAVSKNGMDLNHVGTQVVGAAIAVHSVPGPGLLESAYELCLAHELSKRGLPVRNPSPGFKLGYLFNFNVPRIRDGITRLVNGL